ncbi:hypothetical protein [Moorena producens]|uniref:hypothetical protein n=1 Tax=Moorena producens TaxID=1155739 RepID=UPI003C70AE0E
MANYTDTPNTKSHTVASFRTLVWLSPTSVGSSPLDAMFDWCLLWLGHRAVEIILSMPIWFVASGLSLKDDFHSLKLTRLSGDSEYLLLKFRSLYILQQLDEKV